MINKLFPTKLFLLFFAGCSFFLPNGDHSLENKYILELDKWNTFQMEGVAEIYQDELVLRKYFKAQKNPQALRIDLIESGLLGIHPTPFASIYADTSLTMRTPPDYTIKTNNLNFPIDLNYLKMFSKTISINKIYQDSLFSLQFTNEMFLKCIETEGFHLDLEYNQNTLAKIIIFNKNKKLAKLTIDKIQYEYKKIKQLK